MEVTPIAVPAPPLNGAVTGDQLIARMERLPFTRKHWTLTGVLCTATFFDGYDTLMMASALPLILASMRLPLASAGVVVAATFWGQSIGAPLSGVVAEKWGRRTLLLISCGMMGVTALGAALAQDFNQLIVARAVQGLGLGAEIPIAGAMMSEFMRGAGRGGTVLAYQSMAAWGGLVAPFLAIGLIATIGQDLAWRGMFVFAFLPFLMIFIRNRLLPESPRWLINQGRIKEAESTVELFEQSARSASQALPEPVLVVQPRVQPTSYLELFGSTYLVRTIAVLIWVAMTYSVTYGYLPFVTSLYTSVGELPVTSSLALGVVGSAIPLVSFYTAAATLDRSGRKFWFGWLLFGGAAVMVCGAVVVGAMGLHSWPILFALTVLISIFTTPAVGGLYVFVPELYPTRMRAWATAIGSTAIRVWSSFMPIVVSLVVASQLGLGGVYLLMAVLLTIGGSTLVLFLPETKGRVLEEISS